MTISKHEMRPEEVSVIEILKGGNMSQDACKYWGRVHFAERRDVKTEKAFQTKETKVQTTGRGSFTKVPCVSLQ